MGNGVLQSPVKQAGATVPAIMPAAMTGLPGFEKVKEGLATGRKPELDGFTTLKQAGYKTIIYLYPAGTDVSALRELAGKRGLGFNSIETTPEGLSKALGAFTTSIADKADRPAYVCDDDGVRGGAMWYLYFRTVEFRNDDEARLLAKPLGLTNEGGEGRAFEVAIQQYLANR
jgi:hypothetical protein